MFINFYQRYKYKYYNDNLLFISKQTRTKYQKGKAAITNYCPKIKSAAFLTAKTIANDREYLAGGEV